jgi:hypothetical protein
MHSGFLAVGGKLKRGLRRVDLPAGRQLQFDRTRAAFPV